MIIFKKILLFLFAVSLSLLLTELTLTYLSRVSQRFALLTGQLTIKKSTQGFNSIEELTSTLSCANKPNDIINGFTTNSKGFLTKEVPYEKEHDLFRIVTIGDSFGVGFLPYKYNLFYLLEENLNKKEEKAEVINLSINCINTTIYKDIFNLEGIKYKPDLLIVSVYVGNDFFEHYLNENSNADPEVANAFSQKKSYSSSSDEKKRNTLENILFKSKTFKFLKYLTANRIISSSLPNKRTDYVQFDTLSYDMSDYNPFSPTWSEEVYFDTLKSKTSLFISDSEVYKTEVGGVKKVISNLEEIKKMANLIKSDVLVVIIPDELQVNDELWNQFNQNYPNENLQRFLPQEFFKEKLGSSEMDYLDLLPYIKNASNSAQLYQPLDTHFNSYGNIEASKAIHQMIESKYLAH